MSEAGLEIIVAVAFAHTAEVLAWKAAVTGEERELIRCTLRNLFDLGHVASFSVRSGGSVAADNIVDELRSRIGGLTVDACSVAPVSRHHILPAFLMPVWPFDHKVEGALVATGRLLGLDLDLVATSSPDEETGAHLPGRAGRWLIHARPMF
jgi:hypothetical protein